MLDTKLCSFNVGKQCCNVDGFLATLIAVEKSCMTEHIAHVHDALVRELAAADGAVFLCGRYEGVDQRVIDAAGMLEVSIGDFILSGGEVAALTVMDSVVRLLPGVIGKEASHREESFETGLLEPSLYTHPRNWNGIEAPQILASGHHGRIADWRAEEARRETRERRPDLWERYLQAQARENEAKE